MEVTIRPLEENDAKISYLWRNDIEIWKYTGSKPTQAITYEIEKEWIKKVLKRENEIRFAICVGDNNEYVGNVQLTNITKTDAEFHIFVGNKEFHNKGIGTKATNLILNYSDKVLQLKIVYLFVNKENVAAIKSYKKCGFYEIERNKEQLKLIIKL
ncbi:RimJ/RimL family protein N-acetyltransferase [Flavobacterium sp. 103]|uniref:GNAT family N-acetyltransferase n=1 Tax=Flavobacterium sp. 103 TaxID=2135624 RepID=UPI000D5CEBD5|nr:GNAT family protein [Flavobacterium sp. 103]PVX46612.1 RimJ/RimL family protein N-acetyltransferase [Flavobacterium sp. 103]